MENTTMINRKQIISEARSWVGTPFHKQAKIKNVGCDCVGLILGVAARFDLRSKTSNTPLKDLHYNDYNHFHDKVNFMLALQAHLISAEKRNIGTVIVLGSSSRGWHAGIITEVFDQEALWVHASMQHNKIVEERMICNLSLKAQYFDFCGVID